jgi:hypothetical protein
MNIVERQGFENLQGISGLLTFLNHPMREPQLTGFLKSEFERLFHEAYDEMISRPLTDQKLKIPLGHELINRATVETKSNMNRFAILKSEE